MSQVNQKRKIKVRDNCKKGNHEWYVSKWMMRGTQKKAVEFYCKYCLLTVDELEKEVQSKAALLEQSDA